MSMISFECWGFRIWGLHKSAAHVGAADHHTRSRIIRTTPASRANTSDLSPSRRWCPIANAAPLCVSRTQSRPHETACTSHPTMIVRRSAPVDESHTLQGIFHAKLQNQVPLQVPSYTLQNQRSPPAGPPGRARGSRGRDASLYYPTTLEQWSISPLQVASGCNECNCNISHYLSVHNFPITSPVAVSTHLMAWNFENGHTLPFNRE